MKECKCDCELHPVSSKRSTKNKTEESDIKHPPNPVSGYIVVGIFSGALAWRLDRRHHTLSYHIISCHVMILFTHVYRHHISYLETEPFAPLRRLLRTFRFPPLVSPFTLRGSRSRTRIRLCSCRCRSSYHRVLGMMAISLASFIAPVIVSNIHSKPTHTIPIALSREETAARVPRYKRFWHEPAQQASEAAVGTVDLSVFFAPCRIRCPGDDGVERWAFGKMVRVLALRLATGTAGG